MPPIFSPLGLVLCTSSFALGFLILAMGLI
jgi:hypothetical protein